MKKKVCPICNVRLPKEKGSHSRRIGIPFIQCDACHGYLKSNSCAEYSILSSSAKSSFFVSFTMVLLSIAIPALVAVAIYFTLPHIYALTAIILAPIIFFIAKAVRKRMSRIDIENSALRCSYKGYLEFLRENGFKIKAKRIDKAKDYLELEESLQLFGDLTGYEQFNKHFPIQLGADYAEYMNSQLLSLMKQDSKSAASPIERSTALVVNDSIPGIPDVVGTDISSIEKFIHIILKKYNLSCTENKFQNIKIDIITYIENHDNIDKNALKTIVFNCLKS